MTWRQWITPFAARPTHSQDGRGGREVENQLRRPLIVDIVGGTVEA
ncbi:MAG: hypothetical protein JJE02_04120 [Propionibacteriales bacterium]|nr:hypothetical protein [Propionibacteriales bacterium]